MLSLADLVALDDVVGIHLVAGVRIDLPVSNAVAGLFVELMEADFLALRTRWEQRYGAGDKRQFEVLLPICTRPKTG